MTCNKQVIEERNSIKEKSRDAFGFPNDQKWVPDSSGGYPNNKLNDEYEPIGAHQYDDC